jgi:hypothetical protein
LVKFVSVVGVAAVLASLVREELPAVRRYLKISRM